MSEAKRAYFYRIALAVMALAAAIGVVKGDDLPLWINIVGAVLGIGSAGLATANTKTHPERP